MVHLRTGARDHNRTIIAVDPSLPREEILSLAGLGEALTRFENERRAERGLDPIPAEHPRTGYGNADPWYNGRGSSFGFTIVDSPGRGTALTPPEIEGLVFDRDRWVRPDTEAYLKELMTKYGQPARC